MNRSGHTRFGQKDENRERKSGSDWRLALACWPAVTIPRHQNPRTGPRLRRPRRRRRRAPSYVPDRAASSFPVRTPRASRTHGNFNKRPGDRRPRGRASRPPTTPAKRELKATHSRQGPGKIRSRRGHDSEEWLPGRLHDPELAKLSDEIGEAIATRRAGSECRERHARRRRPTRNIEEELRNAGFDARADR